MSKAGKASNVAATPANNPGSEVNQGSSPADGAESAATSSDASSSAGTTGSGGPSESSGSPAAPAGRKGATPTMPFAIVYQEGERVIASVVSPTGERYSQSGRGKGSAMGGLIDRGFTLAVLHAEGPQWLTALNIAPADKVIGYAAISGFPLPPQD